MNAANEAAVKNFIKGRIKFDKIHYYISKAMRDHRRTANPSLEEILKVDKETREFVEHLITENSKLKTEN